MAQARHFYGEVDNKSDLKKVFSEIRGGVKNAKGRPSSLNSINEPGIWLRFPMLRLGGENSALKQVISGRSRRWSSKRRRRKSTVEPKTFQKHWHRTRL